MDKRFWGILLAIFLVFAGIVYFSQQKKDNGGDTSKVTSHIMGSDKNNVTLVEYGDYQCPACSSYFPVVKEVVDKYKDQIQFQFRNLPLTQIHPNAFAGARAAEAAGLQGKFWEMHDMLYQQQNTWSGASDPKSYFEDYASQLGLDTAKFKTDFASANVNAAINADIAAFKKTGATMQTPSFFLNGKFIKTTASVDSFTKQIDEALANAKKSGDNN